MYKPVWPTVGFRHGVLSLIILLASLPAVRADSLINLDRGGVSVDFNHFRPIDNADESVTLAVLPFSFIDETYCLPSGQAGVLQISARNTAGRTLDKPRIVLRLPAGIRILGLRNGSRSLAAQRTVQRDGQAGSEYEIAFSSPDHSIKPGVYRQSYGEFILLQSDLPAGATLYPAECHFADGEYKGPVRRFNIRVMEPIHGRRPSLFKTGVHIWNEFSYAEPEAIKTLAGTYADAGFNVIQLGTVASPALSAAFKEAGLTRYRETWIRNGYGVMVSGEIPEEAKYRLVDGSAHRRSVCPSAIYTHGAYFTDTMIPALRKILVDNDLTDSLMCNWEPFGYNNTGCFCDRCRTEFIRHSGLSSEQVTAAWPNEIIRQYGSEWAEFRSWQHGRMLVVLHQTTATIGREAGKDSQFIPEISNGFRRGKWPRSQYDPRDYMEDLPVLQAWGPYIFHRYTRPYVFTLGRHLNLYRRAVEPIAYLEETISGPDKRPDLIAFPQGIQCNDWILEPEAIAFQSLCFFAAGWQGAIPYFFPGGYDGRYFKALAEANTLIADHEELVFQGRRLDPAARFRMEVLSPLPDLQGTAQEGVEQHLLQGQEYVLADRRLLAVANFWQHGDVWVRLIPTAVPADGLFAWREISQNRVYVKADGNSALTPDDLRAGMVVHIGALRWAFFTLEPWREDTAYGTPVTPDQLEAARLHYQADLQKQSDTDSATDIIQQKRQAPPDMSAFQPLSLGTAECRLEGQADTGQLVAFNVPGGRLLINPHGGARVTSWLHDGVELVSQSERFGLALDGFMLPEAPFVTGPYELVSQDKDDTQLTISFRRELTADEYGYALGGLVLLKTYHVAADGSGFSVSTELRNESDHDISFAFRYHNIPAPASKQTTPAVWQAALSGAAGEKPAFDVASGRVELFRLQPEAQPEIDRQCSSDRQQAVTAAKMALTWSDGAFGLDVDAVNTDSLYGILFWGFVSGGTPHATLEPLFEEVHLAQGQSWSGGMQWTIKK